jgi:hypothetical protein
LVKDEEPIAKSPIVAVRPKDHELEEEMPPKRECLESRTLKLSEERLDPSDISAKAEYGKEI